MCGRYKQTSSLQTLREMFGVTPGGACGENAAGIVAQDAFGIVTPGMPAPVVHMIDGEVTLSSMIWGFVPHWSRQKPGAPLINARAETIADKPAFRDSFRARRCLIPANAFYEWDIGTKPKRAYEIGLSDDVPFAFAGLWDRWEDPVHGGKPCDTFAIVTTAAQAPLSKIHDRAPVILCGQAHFRQWLDGKNPVPAGLHDLDMKPFDFPAKKRAGAAEDRRQLSLL